MSNGNRKSALRQQIDILQKANAKLRDDNTELNYLNICLCDEIDKVSKENKVLLKALEAFKEKSEEKDGQNNDGTLKET